MAKTIQELLIAYQSYRLINYDPLDEEKRLNQFKMESHRVFDDYSLIKDDSFSQLLNQLITEKYSKDAEFYKKIYMTRQHFSKIINDPDYQPTRETVMRCVVSALN